MADTHSPALLSVDPANHVTAAVTPAPNLDDTKLVMIAREMAWAVRDPAITLAANNLTQDQFDAFVRPNRLYKRAYETFLIEWEAAGTTNKRIAVKASAALEDSLHVLAARMIDAKENLPAVIEAAKMFAKLAGAGEQTRETANGEKFTINIKIGNDQLKFEETIGQTIRGPEIPALPEGPGVQPALLTVIPGQT